MSNIEFDGIQIDAETVRAKLAEHDSFSRKIWDGTGPKPGWCTSCGGDFAARGNRFAMWSNMSRIVAFRANGPAGNSTPYVEPVDSDRPTVPMNGGWYHLEDMRELREAVDAAIAYMER